MSKKCHAEFKAKMDLALDLFIQKYPGVFFPKDLPDIRPLEIGVLTKLTGQNRHIARKVVAAVLARYTKEDRYLRALATSESRFDLDGRPAGWVSEQHRSFAVDSLAARQARQLRSAA